MIIYHTWNFEYVTCIVAIPATIPAPVTMEIYTCSYFFL